MKILMVLTSHGQLGNTGKQTGLWLEELAGPYYVFKDGGAEVVLASPAGGQPPIDPNSERAENASGATRRFHDDGEATRALAQTRKLAEVATESWDAVFFPGGHGPVWDLAENEPLRLLVDRLYAAGKPVAAVCHGLAALKNALGPFGLPLVRGKQVTGFSNSEEQASGLAEVVPFLIEDMLKGHGADYSKAADGKPHVVVTGNLITGQNPASAQPAAEAVLAQLRNPAAAAA